MYLHGRGDCMRPTIAKPASQVHVCGTSKGLVYTWNSSQMLRGLGYHGFTSVWSCWLLLKCWGPVSMLQHIKFFENLSKLLSQHYCVWVSHFCGPHWCCVVIWWAINLKLVGVDSTNQNSSADVQSLGKCITVYPCSNKNSTKFMTRVPMWSCIL